MLRIGWFGAGGRGVGMIKTTLDSKFDVEIVAVCDPYADKCETARDVIIEKTGKAPMITQNEDDVFALDLDAVMIFTSWEAHIPLAIKAMKLGIPAAMEVGGAYSLHDCFRLVDTYEETHTPVMLLENCCYGDIELSVLHAVRQGLFGEIVHCSGGYFHDLRDEVANGEKKRHYRLRNYITRNCENYPTHEIGPIAKVLNINRGNRMLTINSVASKSRGIAEFVKQNAEEYPNLQGVTFNQGDIVTSIITCANGETITITLDTCLPRAYSRGFTVRGTKAAYFEDTDSFFFDDNPDHRACHMRHMKTLWGNAVKYREENVSPLWEKHGEIARKSGHGGMDYMVLAAFYEAVEKGEEPPIDVYDAATWMAITPLSEESIARGGAPVAIPDFTRGKWAMPREKSTLEFSLD